MVVGYVLDVRFLGSWEATALTHSHATAETIGVPTAYLPHGHTPLRVHVYLLGPPTLSAHAIQVSNSLSIISLLMDHPDTTHGTGIFIIN